MTLSISIEHKKRFDEIKKRLSVLGSGEHNFLQVELLFFEALSISKEYGSDPRTNALLASLRLLQQREYEKTKLPTHKKHEREALIRRFISGLRKAL